jgi:hypothetical protein
MKSSAYWKAVLMDRDNVLEGFLEVLERTGVRYCLIGGTGVNAYAYPVVTEDLDIVVASGQIEPLYEEMSRRFQVRRFAHSINVSSPGSRLQLLIQTDERYFGFVERAGVREVLGLRLPVAHIEDVLQGKIWAALDSSRRPSKQLKDLSDIARLLEASPELSRRVPAEILSKIPKQSA